MWFIVGRGGLYAVCLVEREYVWRIEGKLEAEMVALCEVYQIGFPYHAHVRGFGGYKLVVGLFEFLFEIMYLLHVYACAVTHAYEHENDYGEEYYHPSVLTEKVHRHAASLAHVFEKTCSPAGEIPCIGTRGIRFCLTGGGHVWDTEQVLESVYVGIYVK